MKLNYRKTVLVGFVFFLICAFWQAYDTIIPKILTDKFGMAQGPSGVIMALDNILALFLLPFFGALSDKCTSKRGRRTPFIIVGTLIAVVAFLGLSAVDNWQLSAVKDVSPANPEAQAILYEANPTFSTPDGESVVLQEKFTKEAYTAIPMETVNEAGKATANPDYTNYVVPARQAYAGQVTAKNPMILVCFIAVLLILLFAMASFRSPAVALMPDVTVKPLRSKANAIINLMGAAGGIVVLALGIVFSTGATKNALMSYFGFFGIIAAVMLVSLFIFLWTVNEPKLVTEMHEESRKYGLETGDEEQGGSEKLSREEMKSLLLILASVMLWFMGYNAVTSKYSVYAGKVLDLDYNLTLTIASATAIIAYVPIGFLAEKWGRRKTILLGILMLGTAFTVASFMRAGHSQLLMNCLFALAGIGWATINVNSYPMVVELSKNSNVGKYTGYYYTASMAAQTLTPILSGFLMDFRFTVLFPYAAIFVFGSFVTMFLVKHGDAKPIPPKSVLERFDTDD